MPSFNSWFLRQWFDEVIKMMEEKQNGKHRRTSAKVHGDSPDRTSNSAGTAPTFGPFPPPQFTYATINGAIIPQRTKPNSGTYSGIRTGEVIAWRCWWVYMKNERTIPSAPDWQSFVTKVPRLCSIAHQYLWEPGAVETGNVDAWIPMLFENIAGGVYAWSDFADCYDRVCQMCETRNTNFVYSPLPLVGGLDFNPYREAVGIAWGTVKLWGEVVAHRDGWRASHAKVHSIKYSVGDGFCVRELREIYGVGEGTAYLGAPWA